MVYNGKPIKPDDLGGKSHIFGSTPHIGDEILSSFMWGLFHKPFLNSQDSMESHKMFFFVAQVSCLMG